MDLRIPINNRISIYSSYMYILAHISCTIINETHKMANITKINSNGEEGEFSGENVYVMNRENIKSVGISMLGIDLMKMRFPFILDIKREEESNMPYLYIDTSIEYISICKKVVRNGLDINETNITSITTIIENNSNKTYVSKYVNGEIYKNVIKYFIDENRSEDVAKLIRDCGKNVYLSSLQRYLEYTNESILSFLRYMVFPLHDIVNKRHIYIYIVHYIKLIPGTIDRIYDIIDFIFNRHVRENKSVSNLDIHLITSIMCAERKFGTCEPLMNRLKIEMEILPDGEKERVMIHYKKTREIIKLSMEPHFSKNKND